eukprot:3912402-Pyramimonas_sp.AAC.1
MRRHDRGAPGWGDRSGEEEEEEEASDSRVWLAALCDTANMNLLGKCTAPVCVPVLFAQAATMPPMEVK